MCVLRTNTDLDMAEAALHFKRLWVVEAWFPPSKSLLQIRPIYHKCDETSPGHVLYSFLVLVLRQEVRVRLAKDGLDFERADVIKDLESLQMVVMEKDGKRFLLRNEVQGTCGWSSEWPESPCRPRCIRPSQIPAARSRMLLPRSECKTAKNYQITTYGCSMSKKSVDIVALAFIGLGPVSLRRRFLLEE